MNKELELKNTVNHFRQAYMVAIQNVSKEALEMCRFSNAFEKDNDAQTIAKILHKQVNISKKLSAKFQNVGQELYILSEELERIYTSYTSALERFGIIKTEEKEK